MHTLGALRPPLPNPTPNSRNRRLRSSHPPKLNIAQNYPNPIYVALFPGQNMAGSLGFQVERVGLIPTPQKGVLLLAPLPLLTRGWCGHAIGNLWRRAAWVGFKSTLERPPVTITKSLIYTCCQCDGVYVALQLVKHGAWEWNLLLTSTLFLC